MMIAKILAVVVMTLQSTAAFGDGIWADGHVTYEHPSGELVTRECAMFVPSRGVGDVSLKCGSWAISTNEFATDRQNGQVIFSVLFRNVIGAPAGSVALYRGTYLRGTNKAIYYGDVFSSQDSAASLAGNTDWQYAGGFMFAKEIDEDTGRASEAGRSSAAMNRSPYEATEVRTVDYVDLNRYLGNWYEIASFPQSFQKGCVATMANYSLKSNGKIAVRNECRLESFDGPLKTAIGTARVVDRETNAKLKVTFFWPFSGNYWVIDLDPDYRWAVVGDPTREYLWILSRTPQLDETAYQEIVARLETQQGYDVSRLNRTLQPTLP